MKTSGFPEIAATDGSFSPDSLQGKWTVLYFYPKDATPGCTVEGQEFRDLYPQFVDAGAAVYGCSRDSLASHRRFIEKQQFPFALISDSEELLCRAFDVIKEKQMYGKKVMGIERSTFLFNPEGELVQEWRKVKPAGHAQAVLEALRTMQT